jgi:hypothetical protein
MILGGGQRGSLIVVVRSARVKFAPFEQVERLHDSVGRLYHRTGPFPPTKMRMKLGHQALRGTLQFARSLNEDRVYH